MSGPHGGPYGGLCLRPVEVLCLFCAQAGDIPQSQRDALDQAADAIRQRPDLPVTLRCLAQDVYAYQDVVLGAPCDQGRSASSRQAVDVGAPASSWQPSLEFDRKRDLDILAKLDLPPGATLPARTLLHRVRKAIATTAGLCGYEGACSDTWQGCPLALTGQYERGLAMDLSCLIPPRPADELAREKAASVAAMEAATELRIRPHVMMCAVCNYGQKQGRYEPLAADNIVEFIDLIRRKPDEVAVVMAPGADWMICASCPQRVPELNACVNVAGSGGLSNEKRDLDLLQILDLSYEDRLPAREMLRRLFARVPSTTAVCRRDHPELSVWWDGCGVANCTQCNPGYEVGRRMLMDELELSP